MQGSRCHCRHCHPPATSTLDNFIALPAQRLARSLLKVKSKAQQGSHMRVLDA